MGSHRSIAVLMALAALGAMPLAESAPPPRRRLVLDGPEPRREPVIPGASPAPRVHDAERMAAAEAKRARKNAKRAAAHRLL